MQLSFPTPDKYHYIARIALAVLSRSERSYRRLQPIGRNSIFKPHYQKPELNACAKPIGLCWVFISHLNNARRNSHIRQGAATVLVRSGNCRKYDSSTVRRIKPGDGHRHHRSDGQVVERIVQHLIGVAVGIHFEHATRAPRPHSIGHGESLPTNTRRSSLMSYTARPSLLSSVEPPVPALRSVNVPALTLISSNGRPLESTVSDFSVIPRMISWMNALLMTAWFMKTWPPLTTNGVISCPLTSSTIAKR